MSPTPIPRSPSPERLLPPQHRHIPPWRGWLPVVALPLAVVLWLPDAWPRWAFMWLLAAVIFAGCKWLTWRRTAIAGVPGWRHAAYLAAWPGLDATAFLQPRPLPAAALPSPYEWAAAAFKTVLGAALFWGLARLVPTSQPLLAGWIGMIGIVLMLHFGSFHLVSCFWRALGVDAKPLMNRPFAATSVGDFWGRRWNTAFRDLTHRFLFRLLQRRFGPRLAILAGFLFSGLVHELVISAPAGAGYGWPTLFFALQGAAILAERSILGKRLGLGRGGRGWAFTMLTLALPVFGLFHPPFVLAVIVPCMRVFGAF